MKQRSENAGEPCSWAPLAWAVGEPVCSAGPGLKTGDCSKTGLEVQTPLPKLNSIAWGSPTEFQGTIRKQTVAYR